MPRMREWGIKIQSIWHWRIQPPLLGSNLSNFKTTTTTLFINHTQSDTIYIQIQIQYIWHLNLVSIFHIAKQQQSFFMENTDRDCFFVSESFIFFLVFWRLLTPIKPGCHHNHPPHHQAVSLHLVLVDGLRLSLSSSSTLSPIKLLGPVARVAKELREELLPTSFNIIEIGQHHWSTSLHYGLSHSIIRYQSF